MLMASSHRLAAAGIAIAVLILTVSGAPGQEGPRPKSVDIPKTATRLEGIPTVRIDSTETGTMRRLLGNAEALRNRLEIRVIDGQFYWATQENQPLEVHSSGEFTYLSSSEPGKYIKFTRLSDKISYVEHLDQELKSVTYWGELRVVVGK